MGTPPVLFRVARVVVVPEVLPRLNCPVLGR